MRYNYVCVVRSEEEAVNCVLRWCAPILFSLIDSMDVIRLLGAVLTENKVQSCPSCHCGPMLSWQLFEKEPLPSCICVLHTHTQCHMHTNTSMIYFECTMYLPISPCGTGILQVVVIGGSLDLECVSAIVLALVSN